MKKKEVRIECHLCDEVFQPHECINTDKYDGEVKCPKCKACLSIKLVKGKLQKRKFVGRGKKEITLTADDLELISRARQTTAKLIEEYKTKDLSPIDKKDSNSSSE